jgi:acylphosphatase
MIRKRVIVSGRVQGVFFRDTCRRIAGQQGVSGWVRNRSDGRVEAVFEGDPDSVERMVRWARRGPSHARVTAVDVTDEPVEGLPAFEIR